MATPAKDDFYTPAHRRAQERADAQPLADRVVDAIVQDEIDDFYETVFHNCGRCIHPHKRVADSRYVPDADGAQPVPAWKRIDVVQDVLTDDDRARTTAEGGTITFEAYVGKLLAGTS